MIYARNNNNNSALFLLLVATLVATSLGQGGTDSLAPPRNGPCPTSRPSATDDCASTGGYTSCFYEVNTVQCRCVESGPWQCSGVPVVSNLKEKNATDVEGLDVGANSALIDSGATTATVVSSLVVASGALAATLFGL